MYYQFSVENSYQGVSSEEYEDDTEAGVQSEVNKRDIIRLKLEFQIIWIVQIAQYWLQIK